MPLIPKRKWWSIGGKNLSFFSFFIHIKFYNISYILQNITNFFTTLQERHHGERRITTTPLPIYKDMQVNLPYT